MIYAIIGYLVCGVIAYGICYYDFQQKFGKEPHIMGEKWCRKCGRDVALMVLVGGPLGLVVSLCTVKYWGLQYFYKKSTKKEGSGNED